MEVLKEKLIGETKFGKNLKKELIGISINFCFDPVRIDMFVEYKNIYWEYMYIPRNHVLDDGCI